MEGLGSNNNIEPFLKSNIEKTGPHPIVEEVKKEHLPNAGHLSNDMVNVLHSNPNVQQHLMTPS